MTIKELTITESKETEARFPYNGNVTQCGHVGRTPNDGHGRRAYTCTREAGHDGLHVAHAPKGPIATWSTR